MAKHLAIHLLQISGQVRWCTIAHLPILDVGRSSKQDEIHVNELHEGFQNCGNCVEPRIQVDQVHVVQNIQDDAVSFFN